MSISLPPDLAERVQQKVKTAGYRSPDEVIHKALDALDAKEHAEKSFTTRRKEQSIHASMEAISECCPLHS